LLAQMTASRTAAARQTAAQARTPGLSAEERRQLDDGLKDMNDRLEKLRPGTERGPAAERDRVADAEIFAKGITWALRYDAEFNPADVAFLKRALDRGKSRVSALEKGERPWVGKKGKVVRGFVSEVDGSVQPYGVIVPASYDPQSLSGSTSCSTAALGRWASASSGS
jgi:hypothetical protein